jgi:SAM-dependent methyltransferase
MGAVCFVMTARFECRSCGGKRGQLILDLGRQPLANNLLRPEDLDKPEPRFPLRLFLCLDCWLLQIADLVPPVELFSEYFYFSSFSDAMLRHARQTAKRYQDEFTLGPRSLVVEVASNDGYLLKNFVAAKIPCLGIEPAANIAEVARKNGVPTMAEFFGAALAGKLKADGKSADLLLGNNVFAHAPDTNDFVAGLGELLKPDGRIILEFPHAVDFIGKCEFDTIYHEHIFYFSLTALLPLFARHDLEIFHVERLPIHGGSLRLFAGHRGAHAVRDSVAALLAEETGLGLATPDYYAGFTRQAGAIKSALVDCLGELKRQGKSIAAYGAAAKGSTLLNFCGLGRETFDFVADRSTFKQGWFTPGLHLPIVPPEHLLEKMPAYTLLLTWNFADEILAQQRAYRERGGKFIVPIPEAKIV